MEVASYQIILFAFVSAASCALSIHERQRVFKRIAVGACLITGAFLIADYPGLAVAAMLAAVIAVFSSIFLTVRWQCTTRWQGSHDAGDE